VSWSERLIGMKLEHEFTVPAPIDAVWQAMLDPEQVAPCFPGATITSASGDEFAGIVKVRLGPISLQYRGKGRFTGTDHAAHQTVIEASGTASGGQGTAAAKVQASLAENGEGTTVSVITDLTVTGKPAQFGRGLIEDVGKKIIGQFADCLSKALAPAQEPAPVTTAAPPATAAQEQPAPVQPTPVQPARMQPAPPRLAPPPVTDEIDLLDAAGTAVAKRAIPAIGALLVLTLVLRWLRRRRKTRRHTGPVHTPTNAEIATPDVRASGLMEAFTPSESP
jgi:carbon monoxide dehydrogenase subunit G